RARQRLPSIGLYRSGYGRWRRPVLAWSCGINGDRGVVNMLDENGFVLDVVLEGETLEDLAHHLADQGVLHFDGHRTRILQHLRIVKHGIARPRLDLGKDLLQRRALHIDGDALLRIDAGARMETSDEYDDR